MSARTVAEFCYIIASAVVTWFITWGAAWSYPHGAGTIWPVGWVCIVIVVGMGFKPFWESWAADRARAREDG